ncbi:MAG: hypothetical protein Q9165_005378 [Trypethelium subeluteriae]
MTRPQIIRADQTSPSAQDHSLQPEHPSPLGAGPAAPHQAASVYQIVEERQEEKDRLAEAWHATDKLQDESEHDDTQTESNGANGEHLYQRDEQAIQQNGGQSGQEDAEMAESETEVDDDMIDKISSSPSIDDGGLPSLPRWPRRISSLTPTSPPISTPILSSPTPYQSSDLYSPSSSPYTTTPQHIPLSYSTNDIRQPNSPNLDSSSPFDTTPQHFPLSPLAQKKVTLSSKGCRHHLLGEYNWSFDNDDEFYDLEDSPDDVYDPITHEIPTENESPSKKKLRPDSPPPKIAFARASSKAPVESLRNERPFQDEGFVDDLESILLPTNDPLLAAIAADESPSPNGSCSSWISDDEGSSFDEETANDDNDFLFSDDERFIDSGWGGECLRESEDIDFEFVYALHTFVATVEGQANATKGDTMVLLDDSNSYWWLVRIVKDSTIGYLPAEHIETPTERLARLNKHRNIDLSATMLGDNPEKSKNPLKKAMRRRNAKTVTFTAPTYVEPQDFGDFSDEEEHGELETLANGSANNGDEQEIAEGTNHEEVERDETAVVEPLKVNGASKSPAPENPEGAVSGEDNVAEPASDDSAKPRTSDEIISPPDGSRGRSRNGTMRNTDSFFKDDSVETRKITLTPNLLRDDSSSTLRPIEVKESNIGDKLEKSVPPSERPKDDKKRKEKKPGMLSGLFKSKKKDKKGKLVDDDDEKELDSSRVSSPTGQDGLLSEKTLAASQQAPARQLSKGKLQKSPPNSNSPNSRVKSPVMEEPRSMSAPAGMDEKLSGPPTMRLVQSDSEQTPPEETVISPPISTDSQTNDQHLEVGSTKERGGKLSPITNLIRPSESRPERVKKAKQRVELDDFDSSPEDATPPANPFDDPNEMSTSRKASEDSEEIQEITRGTEPAEAGSPFDSMDPRKPPPLTTEHSSDEERSPVSPLASRLMEEQTQPSSTSSSTPTVTSPVSGSRSFASNELGIVGNRSPSHNASTNMAARSSPSSRNTDTPPTPSSQHTSTAISNGPIWSDAALHSYMNGDNDIRDMLLLVRDKTNVVPVSADHPLMKGLFVDEKKSLRDMNRQLDGLLGQWMERKGMAGPGSHSNTRRRINGTTTTKA